MTDIRGNLRTLLSWWKFFVLPKSNFITDPFKYPTSHLGLNSIPDFTTLTKLFISNHIFLIKTLGYEINIFRFQEIKMGQTQNGKDELTLCGSVKHK